MVCWFCDALEEDPKSIYQVSMYGEVDSKTLDSVTKVAYNVIKIDIQRCSLCHSKHRLICLADILSLLFALLAVVIGIITAMGFMSGFLPGLLIGLLIAWIASGLLIRLSLLKGIHSIAYARKHYPKVRELLDKTYRFGRRPKDQEKESRNQSVKGDENV